MGFASFRLLFSFVYACQVVLIGLVYAQSKPPAASITVYKTPT